MKDSPEFVDALAKLPPKRAAFVREYLIDYNGAQAAIRAGYAPKSAREQAGFMLTIPAVSAALSAGRADAAKRTGLSVDWVLDVLKREATNPDPKASASRVRAAELIGKHLGAFTEKVEHVGIGAVNVTFYLPNNGRQGHTIDAG